MKAEGDEEADDGDHVPSDADSEDSLERSRHAKPSMLVSLVNSILNVVGLHLFPAVEDSSKPHPEPRTEPFTPEQEFCEMMLSDCDSDEDADNVPSQSEESDELEYDSDLSLIHI